MVGIYVRITTTKATRKAVFLRDLAKCQYCLCSVTLQTCQIDHFIPVSAGGSPDIANLVLACQPCNHAKGADLWDLGCRTHRQWDEDSVAYIEPEDMGKRALRQAKMAISLHAYSKPVVLVPLRSPIMGLDPVLSGLSQEVLAARDRRSERARWCG